MPPVVEKGKNHVAQVYLNNTRSLYPVLDERGCSPYWVPDRTFTVLYDADEVKPPRHEDARLMLQPNDPIARPCIPVTVSKADLSNFELKCACYIADPSYGEAYASKNSEEIFLFSEDSPEPIASGKIDYQVARDCWQDDNTSVPYLEVFFIFGNFKFM